MQQDKVQNPMGLIIEASQGNPGCIEFLSEAYAISPSHTTDAINKLCKNGIKGADIYRLWHDCCEGVTQFALWVIAAASVDDLKKHINIENPRAYGIPYTDDELRKYAIAATQDYDDKTISQFLYPNMAH